MNVDILFFGPARDAAGMERAQLELPDDARTPHVYAALRERFPDVEPLLASARLAINEHFAKEDSIVRAGDELALIPPVSGGQAISTGSLVRLVRHEICIEDALTVLQGDNRCGGIATFAGATRQEKRPPHGRLMHLEYEAYDAMAERALRELDEQVRSRWPVHRAALLHRLGRVGIGELSVVVGVACGHRKPAFEACSWLIDTLKTEVPIWKREIFEDGFESWSQPCCKAPSGQMNAG